MNKSFHYHFLPPEALTPENQDRFVFPARADNYPDTGGKDMHRKMCIYNVQDFFVDIPKIK